MGDEIPVAIENGRISDLLVTLTSDQVMLHTVMHHLSTSTHIPNFIEIKETFCGRTEHMDEHLRPTLLARLGVDLKLYCVNTCTIPTLIGITQMLELCGLNLLI